MWKGIDGSGIKVHLIDSYGGSPSAARMNKRSKDARCKKTPVETLHIYEYGEGDGGGGANEADFMTIDAIDKLGAFSKVEHTTLEKAVTRLFEKVRLQNYLINVMNARYFAAKEICFVLT